MLFEDLNISTPLKNALNDMGFLYTTPIQAKSFSVIMSGRDTIGIAQTGTGKTIAYLLPLLRQLKYSDQKHPRIAILVPTRELVVQVLEELENLSKYINIRAFGVFGGANINTQAQKVLGGIDVIIGTPGRIYDLVLKGVLSLKSVKKLVVDEVDEMLNQGFRPQVINITDLLPEKRQNILFSATLSEEVEKFFKDFCKNPEKVEIAPHGTPIEQIIQYAYHVPNFYTKINLLVHLLNNHEEINKALIFAQSRKSADHIFELLQEQLPNQIGVIHSNKSQNFRFNSLNKFEKGEYRAIVSTDIMARGLDINNVSHVINISLPERPSDYIHRIGRTGRADKSGIAISFVSDKEQDLQLQVEELMKKTIIIEDLPDGLEISNKLIPDETTSLSNKNYLKVASIKNSQGAYHEKKQKNRKINLGGPGKRKPKAKKPSNRSAKKRKSRN